MIFLDFLIIAAGYALLIAGIKYADRGGLSIMRSGKTSDTVERLYSWIILSLFPYVVIALAGAVQGLGTMIFSGALAAGVFSIIIIPGMLGILGEYKLKGIPLIELAILIVSVVVMIICSNYTWSMGHPRSNFGRLQGIIFLVMVLFYIVYAVSVFSGHSKNLKRKQEYGIMLALIITLAGIAAAVLGGILVVNYTANIAGRLGISQNIPGFLIIGGGLTVIEYYRAAHVLIKKGPDISPKLTIMTGNVGMLVMIGICAVSSGVAIEWGSCVAMMISIAVILGFGAYSYFSGKVSRLTAAAFIAAYSGIFILFMYLNI